MMNDEQGHKPEQYSNGHDDTTQPFTGPFYEFAPPKPAIPKKPGRSNGSEQSVPAAAHASIQGRETISQSYPIGSPSPAPWPVMPQPGSFAAQQAQVALRKRRNARIIGLVAGILCLGIIFSTFYLALAQQQPTTTLPGGGSQGGQTTTLPTKEATNTTTIPKGNATFEKAACPFRPGPGIKEGNQLDCGYLSVPEDRTNPQSKKIKLAVAIFKPNNTNVPAEPVVHLNGGPGGNLLMGWAPFVSSTNLASFTRGHTLIMFDQRGTGYSEPTLDCPEADKVTTDTKDDDLTREKGVELSVAGMRQCHERLLKEGINLRSYTSITNATDVHDLIHALGYQQANLYGVSYGTQLALTIMRLFPEDIRSTILDSPVPLQGNLFKEIPFLTQHAYDTLFKGCAASPTCAAAYPGVEDTFYNLVARLNQQPVTFEDVEYGTILLNGDAFSNFVFSSMYVTSFIPILPRVISQVDQGNYTFLERYYGILMLDSDLSEGMYYSVECGESMAYTSKQEMTIETNKVRPELKPNLLSSIDYYAAICNLWDDEKVPLDQKQAVVSDLPTLILAGEYDPITPPANGELIQKTLSKSYFYTFPGTGHGVFRSDNCPDNIMYNFLQQPTLEPNAACIQQMEAPNFQ